MQSTFASSKLKLVLAWLSLVSLGLLAFLSLFVPLIIGDPSREQTSRDLALAYFLQRNSSFITITLLAVSAGLSIWIWRNTFRRIKKYFLFLPLALMLILIWAAYQNSMEWIFPQLETTAYLSSGDADFVSDSDIVMAVEVNGQAVAYPVRQMLYHHIVNDSVGGIPVVSTY